MKDRKFKYVIAICILFVIVSRTAYCGNAADAIDPGNSGGKPIIIDNRAPYAMIVQGNAMVDPDKAYKEFDYRLGSSENTYAFYSFHWKKNSDNSTSAILNRDIDLQLSPVEGNIELNIQFSELMSECTLIFVREWGQAANIGNYFPISKP